MYYIPNSQYVASETSNTRLALPMTFARYYSRDMQDNVKLGLLEANRKQLIVCVCKDNSKGCVKLRKLPANNSPLVSCDKL